MLLCRWRDWARASAQGQKTRKRLQPASQPEKSNSNVCVPSATPAGLSIYKPHFPPRVTMPSMPGAELRTGGPSPGLRRMDAGREYESWPVGDACVSAEVGPHVCSPKEASELLRAGLVSTGCCLLLRQTDRLHSTEETRKPQRRICTEPSKSEESLPMENMIAERTNLLLKNTTRWTTVALPTLWAVESCFRERLEVIWRKGRRRQICVARHMLTTALLWGPTAQRIGKTGRVRRNGYQSITQQATTKITGMIN